MDPLTKRGRERLTRYIEKLIEVASQGNTWTAETHANDVVYIVTKNLRKR